MITLTIDAFKSLEHVSYSFNEGTVTLLSGKSGSGKTSIIEALYYVLFGKDVVASNMVPYGKKSCSVVLTVGDNIIIRRVNTKHGLTVTITDQTTNTDQKLEDVSAQQYIYEHVCHLSQHHIHMMTQYLKLVVSQHDPFMEWAPNIQWKFIRGFVMDMDVEQVYTKIRANQKRLTSQLDKLGGKIGYMETELVEIKRELGTFNGIHERQTRFTYLQQLKKLYLSWNRDEPDKYREVNDMLYQLMLECKECTVPTITSNAVIDVDTMIVKLDTWKHLTAMINQREAMLKEKQTSLENIKSCPSESVLDEEDMNLKEMAEHIRYYEKKQTLSRQLTELEPDYIATKEANQHLSIVSCPSCTSSLVYVNQQLAIVDNKIIRRYEMLHQSLMNIIAPDVIPDKADYERRMILLRVHQRQCITRSTLLKDISKEQALLTNLINKRDLIGSVEGFEENIRQEQTRQLLMTQTQRRDRIITELLDFVKLNRPWIERTAPVIPNRMYPFDHDDELYDLQEWFKHHPLSVYENLVKREKQISMDVGISRQTQTDTLQLLNRYEELERVITLTETCVIQSTISNLNDGVNYLLSHFFTDPIQIQFSVDMSADQKRIKSVILYNGVECILKNLSAGEQQRIILSVHVYFCRLFGIRFISMDEITNNLDMETIFTVFESIKTWFDSCYSIVVAHQVVEGIFDDIIRLGNS